MTKNKEITNIIESCLVANSLMNFEKEEYLNTLNYKSDYDFRQYQRGGKGIIYFNYFLKYL